jgi:hypothetical protein
MDPILVEAFTLAQFANLKPEQVDAFRNCVCPDFLPNFWKTRTRGGSLAWQEAQRFLRDLWSARPPFPHAEAVKLIIRIDHYRDLTYSVENKPPVGEDWVCPAQRAIMFMAVNPWRARFCPTCGDRVAAATARSTRCDNPGCFEESRRATKREAWRRNGKQWRAKAKRTQKKGKKS